MREEGQPGVRGSPVELLRGAGRALGILWDVDVCGQAQVHALPGGLQVVTVDVRNKKVVFKDGFKLEYSKLLLAPGSRWECLSHCPLLGTGQTLARMGGLRGPGAPH